MVTREKYAEFADVGMVENFENEPPNAKDVVLVLKSHLSSEDISQKPFVFLPASALQKLQGWPEYTVQLNKMSTQTVKDLRKTMDKITQAPWHMHDAARYIDGLIHQQGTVPQVSRCHPLEKLHEELEAGTGRIKPDDGVFKASHVFLSEHGSVLQ